MNQVLKMALCRDARNGYLRLTLLGEDSSMLASVKVEERIFRNAIKGCDGAPTLLPCGGSVQEPATAQHGG
jgi:hypothetical protein